MALLPGFLFSGLALDRVPGESVAMAVRKRTWITAGEQRTAWVVDYRDQNGRRRLKTFETKKAADAWARTAMYEVDHGTHTPDRATVTVEEAARLWLAACKVGRRNRDRGVEASTLRAYQRHVDRHIVPLIGTVKLNKLGPARVETFRTELLKTRSPGTAAPAFASFKSIIKHALSLNLVGRDVAAGFGVARPRRHRDDVTIPTVEHVRALVATAQRRTVEGGKGRGAPHLKWAWRYYLMLRTALATGMRPSELRGLPWRDVDLDAGRLTITQRADDDNEIGPPKSAEARRTLSLPSGLVRELREWKLACPKGKLGLVFPNWQGNVESLSNVHGRFWKPCQIAAGIYRVEPPKVEGGAPIKRPLYDWYCLRHYFASKLIDQGAHAKKVQRVMGHHSVAFTLDTYGHLFERAAKELAADVEAMEVELLADPVRQERNIGAEVVEISEQKQGAMRAAPKES